MYDGDVPLLELSASGAVQALNTWGAAGLAWRRRPSQGDVFYTFDPIGNPVHRLDANGNVLSTSRFDAWGSPLTALDASDPYSGYKSQHGYYTDHETGLILCTHRFYDPSIGRFLTRDPIGYAGGINLYSYCANNPVNFIDLSGLDPDDDGPRGGRGLIRQRDSVSKRTICQYTHNRLYQPWRRFWRSALAASLGRRFPLA